MFSNLIALMRIHDIEVKIHNYQNQYHKIFATSSLQSHSVVLLHILSRIDSSIPIYFVNTGFHFPETIAYKEKIAQEFGIKIHDLNSVVSKNLQKDSKGNLLFTYDPDYCCFLNKIQPVELLMAEMDVWISGVRANQSENRKRLHEEEAAAHGILRYHPLLRWTDEQINDYISEYKLPKHPLDSKGYLSIGCEPCTRKVTGENGRDSRWFGMNKTECGLNTDLIIKK